MRPLFKKTRNLHGHGPKPSVPRRILKPHYVAILRADHILPFAAKSVASQPLAASRIPYIMVFPQKAKTMTCA